MLRLYFCIILIRFRPDHFTQFRSGFGQIDLIRFQPRFGRAELKLFSDLYCSNKSKWNKQKKFFRCSQINQKFSLCENFGRTSQNRAELDRIEMRFRRNANPNPKNRFPIKYISMKFKKMGFQRNNFQENLIRWNDNSGIIDGTAFGEWSHYFCMYAVH